jgi:hypothetical protein
MKKKLYTVITVLLTLVFISSTSTANAYSFPNTVTGNKLTNVGEVYDYTFTTNLHYLTPQELKDFQLLRREVLLRKACDGTTLLYNEGVAIVPNAPYCITPPAVKTLRAKNRVLLTYNDTLNYVSERFCDVRDLVYLIQGRTFDDGYHDQVSIHSIIHIYSNSPMCSDKALNAGQTK